MADNRTKVDALKELGEKVTGATLVAEENETIVGMIDKITENYSGGGGGSTADCEKLANKVTSLSASSTDTEYPSAKCVFNYVASQIGAVMNAEY